MAPWLGSHVAYTMNAQVIGALPKWAAMHW
jgi:hypothetical protein